MSIRILWPGRTHNVHFRESIADYAERIQRLSPFEIVETREENATDSGRARRLRKESQALERKRRAPVTVVLDPAGRQFSSEDFADWIGKQSADIDFILGGPEGLVIEKPTLLLSFGRMTLPHELARVVLLEQIYRAITILKRIPYHK